MLQASKSGCVSAGWFLSLAPSMASAVNLSSQSGKASGAKLN